MLDLETRHRRPEADWDRFFMDLASRTARMSKDPDRKVGAVLVSPDRRQLSFGYNGLPSGMADVPMWLDDKAFKLANMVHAEKNCLQQAPFPTPGTTLYVTRFPCQHCAEAIIEARVSQVVAPKPDFGHLRWGDSWMHALVALRNAHILVIHTEVN